MEDNPILLEGEDDLNFIVGVKGNTGLVEAVDHELILEQIIRLLVQVCPELPPQAQG